MGREENRTFQNSVAIATAWMTTFNYHGAFSSVSVLLGQPAPMLPTHHRQIHEDSFQWFPVASQGHHLPSPCLSSYVSHMTTSAPVNLVKLTSGIRPALSHCSVRANPTPSTLKKRNFNSLPKCSSHPTYFWSFQIIPIIGDNNLLGKNNNCQGRRYGHTAWMVAQDPMLKGAPHLV